MPEDGTTGPQNVVVGDSFGTELPVSQVPEEALVIEKNAAKFSKSKEYRALKEHLETRIKFFQDYLPDGTSIALQPKADALNNWIIANVIIGEFKAVLDFYTQANEVVKNVRPKDA